LVTATRPCPLRLTFPKSDARQARDVHEYRAARRPACPRSEWRAGGFPLQDRARSIAQAQCATSSRPGPPRELWSEKGGACFSPSTDRYQNAGRHPAFDHGHRRVLAALDHHHSLPLAGLRRNKPLPTRQSSAHVLGSIGAGPSPTSTSIAMEVTAEAWRFPFHPST
jgi:hypothetical protein